MKSEKDRTRGELKDLQLSSRAEISALQAKLQEQIESQIKELTATRSSLQASCPASKCTISSCRGGLGLVYNSVRSAIQRMTMNISVKSVSKRCDEVDKTKACTSPFKAAGSQLIEVMICTKPAGSIDSSFKGTIEAVASCEGRFATCHSSS